jgi:hypothetical protein
MTTAPSPTNTLGDNEEANYQLFLDQVQQSGLIWGLYGDDGWALCQSIEFEDTEVFPFWSHESFASAVCTDEWKVYKPRSITIEEFLTEWLPGIHEDNAMVGPNWDAELTGIEVEPVDLARALGDLAESEDETE